MEKQQFESTLTSTTHSAAVWDNTQFKPMLDGLYSLLADCRKLVEAAEKNKELELVINEHIDKQNIKCRKTASVETKIIKIVFPEVGKHRQSDYTKVILAAKEQGKSGDEVVEWINDKNGIHQIKLSTTKSGETNDIKKQKGQDYLNSAVTLYKIPNLLDAKSVDSNVLMIGRVNQENEIEIVEFLENETLMKTALINYYGEYKAKEDSGIIKKREEVQNELALQNSLQNAMNSQSASQHSKEA